jgi:hypothetical protein
MPDPPMLNLLSQFLTHFQRVTSSDDNSHTAQCPAHEDQKNSLSITYNPETQKILLKCFAGCEVKQIIERAGLTLQDLFLNTTDPPVKKRIVATYDYVDETGTLLFQTVRYDPKDFKQRRPGPTKSDWIYNLKGVRRVLYRLPQVIAASDVLIIEGEKDVETAEKLGFVATCNPMGAGKWQPDYTEVLRGKHVTLIPDNDAPGKAHMLKIASCLHGVAQDIRLMEPLPGVPDKGDLSDWTSLTPDHSAAALQSLIAATPLFTPIPQPELPFCFWYIQEGELKIDQAYLMKFLETEGYKKLYLNPAKTKTMLIHQQDHLVQETTVENIQNFVLRECIQRLPPFLAPYIGREVLEKVLMKGVNVYLSEPKLNALPFVEIDFLRDTADQGYFFFQNGFVVINADGWQLLPYADLPGSIWRSQICQRDAILPGAEMTPAIYEDGDFGMVCQHICTQKTTTTTAVFDGQRFNSLKTMLGYLLHNYNNPANTRAVILSEASLDDGNNGRTGKGLLLQAVGKLRKVIRIDGRNHQFDRNFALSRVTRDAQLVFFDDVSRRFDLERLYSCISEGYVVEMKHTPEFEFPIAENPKTAVSTNYAILGNGSSHDARVFEFELLNYYDDAFTPRQELSQDLWATTWTADQWASFDNFMFSCVYDYLQQGLLPYATETLELKKIMTQVGKPFLEFADELPRDAEFDGDAAYTRYQTTLSLKQQETYTRNKFGRDLKAYGFAKHLIFEKKRGPQNVGMSYILKNHTEFVF